MKYKFTVDFDDETEQFWCDTPDTKIKIVHSGSSYLRINADNIYGTIGTHEVNDQYMTYCDEHSEYKFLTIAIRVHTPEEKSYFKEHQVDKNI